MVLTDWPKQAGYRVPSEISYSPTKGGHRQWGFDIEPGSEILLGTKLLFDTQPLKQELVCVPRALDGMKDMKMDLMRWGDNKIPQFPPYDPVEIVTDYLRHVRKWTINSIERQYGRGYIDKLVTDIVYTVPVVSVPTCHLSTCIELDMLIWPRCDSTGLGRRIICCSKQLPLRGLQERFSRVSDG